MKKYLATIFCIVVLAVCFALPAYAMGSIDADSVVMSVDEMTCVNYALDYAEAYYNEIYGTTDTDGIFDSTVLIENELVSRYLQERSKYRNTSKLRYSYSDYVGDFSLYEVQTVGDMICCDISCKISFKYSGAPSKSLVKCFMFFTFTKNINGDWVLSDLYEPELFDASGRGEFYILDEFIKSAAPITSELVDKLISERQTYEYTLINGRTSDVVAVESQKSGDTIDIVQDEAELNSVNATLYSLDRNAMVTYAMFNFDGDPPESGNSSLAQYVNMYDSGGDCTNFVSHCILSGGAVPYQTSNGWYCNSDSDRTSSWSYVVPFYNFVTNNTTYGPTGVHRSLSLNSSPSYDIGDIIQIDYNSSGGFSSDWNHSVMIIGFLAEDGYSYVPYITYRSNSRYGKYNVSFIDEYYSKSTYGSARVIELLGYYNTYT